MGRLLALVAVAVLVFGPGVAYACPVCFQAKNDASRLAFLVTTLFMTVLPLGLFGGIAYWVKRRSEALDDGDRDLAPPGADAMPSRGPEPVAPQHGRPTPAR